MDCAILASEALKLPAWERAQIIDALWRSLDPAEHVRAQHRLMEALKDGGVDILTNTKVGRFTAVSASGN